MQKDKRQSAFLLRTGIIVAAIVLHQIFLPWWGLAIACLLAGYLTAPMGRSAFLAAFSAAFLTWSLYALYLDLQNDEILSSRMIQLFPLPDVPLLLVPITGLLGGVVGGFACKSGDLFRRFFWKEKARYY